MLGIGTKQFLQKKYKTFDELPTEFKDFIGKLMHGFVAIVYAESGEGKTEFCVRLAKALMALDDVAWLSYEQKHDMDLQNAIIRNKIAEAPGRITWFNPIKKMPVALEGETRSAHILRTLKLYMAKRNCPRFLFIDSLDYLRFSVAQYFDLREAAEQKGICLIFLSHAKAGKPKTNVGEEVEYNGHLGIFIKDYIAFMVKNRLGGRGEYIIWEEEARKRNPVYFAKRDGTELPNQKVKNGASKKPRKPRKPKQKKEGEHD